MMLDTSIIVDLLRGNVSTQELITNLERNHVLKISAITVFELELYVPSQKMNLIMKRIKVIPVSQNIARSAGVICKQLIDAGNEIDKEDCIIAASALDQNESLVTKNKRHFSRISGLAMYE